ncbi:hypothetical protein FB451DRAFT_1452344 [Mycena latifolia]|nr:hypothetical protein FB451DRAFT_1452344 [Mycena latifolia]
MAGPTVHGAPDGFFTLEGLPALTLGITSPVARVGSPVSFLLSRAFPHSRALICAHLRAGGRGRRRAPRAVASFAPNFDLSPVRPSPPFVVRHTESNVLRRPPYPPSRTPSAPSRRCVLTLVKACTVPVRAVASADTHLRHLPRLLRPDSVQPVQGAGTYARVGPTDVFESERARGLFGVEFASRYRLALAEFAEGNQDAGTYEDEDAPLPLVLPYGFVHEHMWHGSTGAAPWAWAWAVETSECACSTLARADFSRTGAWSWL